MFCRPGACAAGARKSPAKRTRNARPYDADGGKCVFRTRGPMQASPLRWNRSLLQLPLALRRRSQAGGHTGRPYRTPPAGLRPATSPKALRALGEALARCVYRGRAGIGVRQSVRFPPVFSPEIARKPHMFCLSASGAPPHSRALPLRLSTRIRNTATVWAMASVKTASSPVCWARMVESARHFSDGSSTGEAYPVPVRLR